MQTRYDHLLEDCTQEELACMKMLVEKWELIDQKYEDAYEKGTVSHDVDCFIVDCEGDGNCFPTRGEDHFVSPVVSEPYEVTAYLRFKEYREYKIEKARRNYERQLTMGVSL